MRLPHGIRARIALALVGIVGGALLAAYLIVVPSLEQRLVASRLDQLERLAVPLSRQLPTNRFVWQDSVETFAAAADARVVAYEPLKRVPPALAVVADSRVGNSRDVENSPVALQALESGDLQRSRMARGAQPLAAVAVALDWGPVVLFEASLSESLATVELVKRRMLVATAVALAVAALLGIAAAAMLARRLRRLEGAAERIAAGQFDVPVVDTGDDEIGDLARAFERMRVRLERLDSARKEFVANASHELRTPLFSLGGFLELLADEELDEETRRGFLATMEDQVERLTRLSTDLLDLSRVDAGRLRVEHEPVDLAESAGMLAEETDPIARRTGSSVAVEAAAPVWAVGDEERVLQAGRALLANALVHTPPGTTVVVRARQDGDAAVLEIEDDGPGIAPEHQDAIFERFYRLEGGIASGSGLGLPIARELATLMGGNVRLESRPGRTVFRLVLPAEPVGSVFT